MKRYKLHKALMTLVLLSIGFTAVAFTPQEAVGQRRVRAYIPPDQLVSFLPSTPFNRFTEYLNPIFERVTGKSIIDPESRDHPIGISISGLHFLDALELVLQYNTLEYRETDQYFMIQVKAPEQFIKDADAATGTLRGVEAGEIALPATLDTRQIEIRAVLFELNHSLSKDTGIDWSVLFGSTGSTAGGGSSSSGGQGSENDLSFFLKTDKLFKNLDNILIAPDQIDFKDLNSLFRMAEAIGVGETIATPSIMVQSGIEGSIQIGSDVPVQIRDTFGNISTEYFKTGIIIDVTPTLIVQPLADTLGSPTVEFVHIEIHVEKSGSRPSAAGSIIDRSSANTQLILLDGEQAVIGGLYSTEETISRRGVPYLKDFPKWFFGFPYIFGRTQRATVQKELIISIQASFIDPVRDRLAKNLADNLLMKQREAVKRTLERFDVGVAADVESSSKLDRGNK